MLSFNKDYLSSVCNPQYQKFCIVVWRNERYRSKNTKMQRNKLWIARKQLMFI